MEIVDEDTRDENAKDQNNSATEPQDIPQPVHLPQDSTPLRTATDHPAILKDSESEKDQEILDNDDHILASALCEEIHSGSADAFDSKDTPDHDKDYETPPEPSDSSCDDEDFGHHGKRPRKRTRTMPNANKYTFAKTAREVHARRQASRPPHVRYKLPGRRSLSRNRTKEKRFRTQTQEIQTFEEKIQKRHGSKIITP